MERVLRLIISCPDQVGIVARVSGFLAQYNGSILEANHHADLEQGRFLCATKLKPARCPLVRIN